MQIGNLTDSDIESHINTLIKEGQLSSSSITKALDVLNAAMTWAVRQGYIENNPVSRVRDSLIKKLKKMEEKNADDADVMVLSSEEEKAFIEEASKTDSNGNPVYWAGDYLLLLLYTGMRCGELIGLRWDMVDRENGIIKIENNASMAKNRDKKDDNENNYIMIVGSTKNQKARIIELTQDAKKVLDRIYLLSKWKEPEDFVAPTKTDDSGWKGKTDCKNTRKIERRGRLREISWLLIKLWRRICIVAAFKMW